MKHKVVGWMIVILLLLYVKNSPDAAANSVESAIGMAGDLADSFGKMLTALTT